MTHVCTPDYTPAARGKQTRNAPKPERAVRFIDLDSNTLIAIFVAYNPQQARNRAHHHRVTLDFNTGRCHCDCAGRAHTDPRISLFAYYEMSRPCRHIRLAVEWAEQRMGWLEKGAQGAYTRCDNKRAVDFYNWVKADLSCEWIAWPWYSFGNGSVV